MKSRLLFSTKKFVASSKENPWLNACLKFGAGGSQLYASGYKRAAELLVEHALQQQMDLDTLVYPILFLYRQCIELQLKSIIKKGSILLEIRIRVPFTHDLTRLWTLGRSILVGIYDDDKEAINYLETMILQLSKSDPNSQAFRYPHDKNGNVSLSEVTHVNLKAISEALGEVVNLLDGAAAGISEYLSNTRI
jgi:hypothetical protein